MVSIGGERSNDMEQSIASVGNHVWLSLVFVDVHEVSYGEVLCVLVHHLALLS